MNSDNSHIYELNEHYDLIANDSAIQHSFGIVYDFGLPPYAIPQEKAFIHFESTEPQAKEQRIYLNYRLFGFIDLIKLPRQPVSFMLSDFCIGHSLDLDGLEDRNFPTRLDVASRVVAAVRAMTPETLGGIHCAIWGIVPPDADTHIRYVVVRNDWFYSSAFNGYIEEMDYAYFFCSRRCADLFAAAQNSLKAPDYPRATVREITTERKTDGTL